MKKREIITIISVFLTNGLSVIYKGELKDKLNIMDINLLLTILMISSIIFTGLLFTFWHLRDKSNANKELIDLLYKDTDTKLKVLDAIQKKKFDYIYNDCIEKIDVERRRLKSPNSFLTELEKELINTIRQKDKTEFERIVKSSSMFFNKE